MPASSNMIGVFVTFDLGADFDAARLTQLAQAALPKFQGMPELVSKTFTIDAGARQAVNFYVWRSEAAARRFFSEETLAWVTGVYGVQPTLRFVQVAGRVENRGELNG
jgi:hypothetical protein